MRRSFALAFISFVVGTICVAQAQLGMTGIGGGGFGSGGAAGCSQATSFLARTSGLSGGDITNYTTLICGLETDGVGCSNTLDALYVWAAPDQTTANLNLCSASYPITATNSPTFSANHGYTGITASSTSLGTAFTPSTATTPFYVVGSASLGGYVLTNRSSNATYAIAGTGESAGGTATTYLISFYSDGNAYARLNGATGVVAASPNAQGQWITSHTSTQDDLYKNGNTTPFATTGSTLGILPSCPITFLARPAAGGSCTLGDFSSDQLAFGFIGKELSAANMALVAGRINTLATTLTIAVY